MPDEIRDPDPKKGEAPLAVQSVTDTTPAAADEDSAPGPYDGLELDRPPVSSSQAPAELAQSLVAGAGAGAAPPEPPSEPEVVQAEETPAPKASSTKK